MVTFNITIEKDEDGWFVSEVIELPGCHTQAKTIKQLLERTREAIKAYLGDNNPEFQGEFIGVKKIEV